MNLKRTVKSNRIALHGTEGEQRTRPIEFIGYEPDSIGTG